MNKFNYKVDYLNLILFILIFVWLILIHFNFLSILFPSLSVLDLFISKMFSIVCHQEKDKVLTCSGHSAFVCFRCLGLYWGVFISSFFLFIFKRLYNAANKKLFFTSLIFIGIDVLLVNLGIYKYNNYITFLTGFLLGFICFLYLYKSIFEQLSENKVIDE